AKLDRHARAAGDRRDFVWNVLSADHDLRATQLADAVHDLRNRGLFDGYPARDDWCRAAGGLVHRASVVALDLLDFCGSNDADAVVRVPGDSAPAPAHWPEAGDQLAGVLVCQRRLEHDLRRARSGGTIELVGIGSDRWDAGERRIPGHLRSSSPLAVAQPAGESCLSRSTKHADSGSQPVLIPFRHTRNRLAGSGLSGRDTGVSTA